MAVTIKNAYMAQLAGAAATLYTCPANTQARVLKCVATNDTTVADTATFYKVPSGGAAGVTNLIMNAKAIGDKESYECPEVVGQVLDAGDTIDALAGTADQITVALDVVEIV
jgi:hypothetical protein